MKRKEHYELCLRRWGVTQSCHQRRPAAVVIDYVASVNPPPTASMTRPDSNSQQVFNVTASRKPWLARLAVTSVDPTVELTMVDRDRTCGDIS